MAIYYKKYPQEQVKLITHLEAVRYIADSKGNGHIIRTYDPYLTKVRCSEETFIWNCK